jgi:hypothetical protein
MRRSISELTAALQLLIETFSVSEFLGYCSPSVPELERAWVKKKGQPAGQAKESFKKFLGNLLTEKRNAPSLKALMTYDTWKATNPDDEWLGLDPSQMDEEQNELDDLIRALHEDAKALAELQKALQRVRTTLSGDEN